MTNDDLEPLDPRTAQQMYLDQRRGELAQRTIRSHGYRTDQFVDWCDDNHIENLNELTARDVHNFRVHRREDDDLAPATMRGQLSTLRRYLQFCESISAVRNGLSETIILPTPSEVNVRDDTVEPDKAKEILDYLERYEYASTEHAFLETIWHTGIRLGSAVGCDVENYSPETQSLEILHRPESDTPLKNKEHGERIVALSDRVCRILDDYIDNNRNDIVDEHDREPLFTTSRSRLSRQRGRSIAYQFTRPCAINRECPHDRIIKQCKAAPTDRAHKCPSSQSPHAFRRGSITFHLLNNTPKTVVEDRMDASSKIIDRFYDQRNRFQQMEARRDYLPED